jgi:membrane protease YdiL (CAAX protease family)
MQEIEQERQSGLKLTIILLYIFGFGALTVIGGEGDIGLNMDDMNVINMLKVAQALAVILIFILPAVLFATLWTKQRIHYLGITTKPAISTLVIAGAGMLLAMPVINWLAEMNQQMHLPQALKGVEEWMKSSEDKAAQLTDAFTKGTSIGTLILNLFVIAFMAAVSEEIFFRGMLQKVLIECTKNKHVGIWIGAALFSAFHMQFFGFVPRMLMGAYLGYMFMWSGSLWPGMIAHFVNNGVAVYLAWLANRGTINVDADKIGTENNEWVYVVTSAIMVVLSLILVYRGEMKRREVLNSNI